MKIVRFFICLCVLVSMLSFSANSRESLRSKIRERIAAKIKGNASEDLQTIVVGGKKRGYILHIPKKYSSKKVPLVIVLHGGGGNAQSGVVMSGFNKKSDQEGFIVVYPNGSGKRKNKFLTWNAGNCCKYSQENNIDDVGFIKVLIEHLENTYNIDSNRIYATGMSNGAMMAERLACELTGKISAIADVAGTLSYGINSIKGPISVLMIHGTNDKHVPYEGGFGPESIVKEVDNRPILETANFWTKNNSCSIDFYEEKVSKNVVRKAYNNCAGDSEVVLYTIKDGEHVWPGFKKTRNKTDTTSWEISATDIIWDFFSRH